MNLNDKTRKAFDARISISKAHRQGRVWAQHACLLLDSGITPIAVRPGTKAGQENWTKVSASDQRDRTSCSAFADRGVAARCGDGLVAIDVDTDVPAVKRAIARELRKHDVTISNGRAKRGSKGATFFFFDPTNTISAASWKRTGQPGIDYPEGETETFFEILAGPMRKTTLPPSIHPKTGETYDWLTDQTLYNIESVEDLPTITPELVADLRAALKPWLRPDRPKAQPRITVPIRDGGLSFAERRRLEEYARATVRGRAEDLAHMTGQRRIHVFQTGCRVGRYVHHGLIDIAEIESAIATAWAASGAAKKHGATEYRRHLQSGIAKAGNDPLELPGSIGGAA